MVYKKSLVCALVSLMLTFNVLGCCQSTPALTEQEAEKIPARQSAWLAYWDAEEGVKVGKKNKNKLYSLVYFAGNFTPEGKLTYPLELINAQKNMGKGKYLSYLSVVNDITDKGKNVALKDTKIVAKVLETPEARRAHIAELVELARKNKMQGLEIDYENIWKNEETAKIFPSFVEELYAKTQEAELKLRVVLEPSTPFKQVQFIAGPEYVVMLYNLYGLHSEPGPKANRQFIYNTVAKMASLPDTRAVALANGGCVWSNKEKPRFITEKEAVALQKKHKAEVTRDVNSHCQMFRYREGTNVYDVWYADSDTIKQWAVWAKQGNITNISLWRF